MPTTSCPAPDGLADRATSTLASLVSRRIAAQPDAIAVRHAGTAISYAALAREADRWVVALQQRGVRRGDLVGVCLPRDAALVAGLLAIHRLGAAYVPLDPAYPAARIEHIVRDSRVRLVLADERTIGPLGDVDRILTHDLGDGTPTAPEEAPTPDDLAYVIYTSGSTGLPKGVAIEHRQAAHLVTWAGGEYDADEWSGVLWSTSICFDLSVFEMFATLGNGGTIVVAEHALELPTLADAAHVRLVNTVPSAAGMLVREAGIPGSVRTMNLAGEPLTRALADGVHRAGVERVVNLYGPSEDTTYSTWAEVPRGDDAEPTIGVPLPGSWAHVLDEHGALVADGEVGELYLGGAGVARGYLHRPALTAERFLQDAEHAGERMYRTGDLVQREPDGALRYRGRVDHQVKIRGFRVELGEIEATIARDDEVEHVVVVVREDAGGAPALVAFVGSATASADLESRLRARCEERLAQYMVPARIEVLPRLPLTPNGKVDRAALPAVDWRAGVHGATPATPVERLVAECWAEVLDLDAAPVDVAFAALGGSSLLAASVVHRLARSTGKRVGLADFPVHSTVRDLVASLDAAAEVVERPLVAAGVGTGRRYRATPAQDELFALEQMTASSAVSVMPMLVEIDASVDLGTLQRALDEMPRRHEVLRTAIDAKHDGLEAVVLEPAPVPLAVVADEDELRSLASRPMPVTSGRLLDAAVVPSVGGSTLLLLRAHHAAFDGWSISLLVRDLAEVHAAMAAGTAVPPSPSLQFADGAEWLAVERAAIDERAKAHWRTRLAGPPEAAALPPTRANHGRRAIDRAGDVVAHELEPALIEALDAFARAHGVTAYACIMAATAVRVHRETGNTDMVVQVPVSDRRHPDLESVIGPAMVTSPARIDIAGDPSFVELARRISIATAVDLDLAWIDSFSMFEPLGLRRFGGAEPRPGMLVAVQTYPAGAHTVDGMTWRAVEELSNGSAKLDSSWFWDLTHAVSPRLQVEFDTALHTSEGVRRHAAQVLRLLAHGLGAPDVSVGDLDWVDEDDRRAIAASNPASPIVATMSVPQRMAAAVAATPTAIAIVDHDGTTMTFAELHTRALAIAAHVRATIGDGDEPIAVGARRSAAGIAAMLGTWLAGRPYLPIDLSHPESLLRMVLGDSGAAMLLHDDACPTLDGVTAPRARIDGIAASVSEPAMPGQDELPGHSGLDATAYVIFTSGSTGRPKGVRVGHRALASFVDAIAAVAPVERGDVVTYLTTPSFDIAGLELWLTLARGATVGVVDESAARDGFTLAARVLELGATTVQATPSTWQLLLDADADLAIERALVGGEVVPPGLASELVLRVDEVWNVYGPTEATIWSCAHRVGADDAMGTAVPIGSPLANTQAFVLDHAGRLAPVGAVGTIHLAGSSLAEGYHERPDLTAAAFVESRGVPGRPRIYRTGDLGVLRPDGVLESHGRVDDQVKVRGYRLELQEVDEAIRQVPGVARATTRLEREGVAAGELVGYVVPAAGVTLDVPTLRGWLAERLPGAAVPSRWVWLDALPLGSSGKVDRSALPSPSSSTAAVDDEPLGELEEFVAEIWAMHLPTSSLGRHADFFEHGGHSLTATRVVAQVRSELELELPVRSLFEHSTLAGFSAAVERALAQDLEPTP